jgi:DNA-directed RNA polymerase alpha subunit
MSHLSDLQRLTISECWCKIGNSYRHGDLFPRIVALMIKHRVRFADGSPRELRLNSQDVRELGLTEATFKILLRGDITSIGLLRHISEDDLLELFRFGKGRLEEVRTALARRKITLRSR